MATTNGSSTRRLEALEQRLLIPAPGAGHELRDRLAARLATLAERIHAAAGPAPADDPGDAPIGRLVAGAMRAAAGVGAWGSPEYGARFWAHAEAALLERVRGGGGR